MSSGTVLKLQSMITVTSQLWMAATAIPGIICILNHLWTPYPVSTPCIWCATHLKTTLLLFLPGFRVGGLLRNSGNSMPGILASELQRGGLSDNSADRQLCGPSRLIPARDVIQFRTLFCRVLTLQHAWASFGWTSYFCPPLNQRSPGT